MNSSAKRGGLGVAPQVSKYWCDVAVLPDGVHEGVLITVEDGRFTAVTPGAERGDAERLAGLTVPGLANCHSHAFHRALRGRTQGTGTFWTWREQMYQVAGRLNPDSYFELARAVYGEMAMAGITTVGEFHYLHHGPGGSRYYDPNAMGHALIAAAREAGIRIALLDTCYLTGGVGEPLGDVQLRFGDADALAWADRVSYLTDERADDVTIGAAAHSVRAVPREQLEIVATALLDAPLHVHLSEQQAENEACLAAYNRTPTQLLDETGFLNSRTTVVHATHLTRVDIGLLGGAATHACFCPTTERDLADGIGPSVALREAGTRLTLGSDSHAVIDLFEEMRAVELDERLASRRRGHWSAAQLFDAATAHRSLGFADLGRIETGARADLVTVRSDSVRTAGAGAGLEALVYAASAADVTDVIRDGQRIVAEGKHVGFDVAQALVDAMR